MNPRFALAASLAASIAILATSAHAELTLPRVSPNATVTQTIGITNLTLTYSRPGVKGRAIWGALVPYDKPWRTGANEATNFTTTDDITFGGQKLAAGRYALFTIPAAGAWTVVISNQKDIFGAFDYDSTKDALRVTATPDTTQPNQEWMWIGFDDLTPASCNLVLRWQRLRLAVPIAVDVNATVLARCRTEVAAAKPDDWSTPSRAAGWCLDNNVALDEGATWLKKSLAIQKAYGNMAVQARWLWKDGKKKEAIAMAKDAIATGKASKDKPNTTATENLIKEWSAAK